MTQADRIAELEAQVAEVRVIAEEALLLVQRLLGHGPRSPEDSRRDILERRAARRRSA